MKKRNYKGRCEKRSIPKCKDVCRTYDPIQYVYAEMLSQDESIEEFQCNVPIGILGDIIEDAHKLCMDVARIEDDEVFESDKNAKIAVMYAVAYFYEHKEEADHKALTL